MFVPQIGTGKYILWTNYIPNNRIVVKLLKNNGNSWYLGMSEETKIGIIKHWKLLKIPIILYKVKDANGKEVIFKKGNYIQIKLNIMSNGTINEEIPYLDPVKVTPDHAHSFEETRTNIDLITSSVNESVFLDTTEWIFPTIQKVYIPGENSRLPLVEKVYEYASNLNE